MIVNTFYACHQCGSNSFYRRLCSKCSQEYGKKYYQKNKDKLLKQCKDYRTENKDKVNSYYRKRRKKDKLYQLKANLRTRLWNFCHDSKQTKRKSTVELLGCSWEELMSHIETLFSPGMSWDNRDEWHIDHIIPLSSAKSQEEMENLCHYTNLQPLWVLDNLKKGNSKPNHAE